MKRRITQLIAFAFLCAMLGTLQLHAQGKVLFLAGSASLNTSDGYVKTLMEAKGYTVTVVSAPSSTEADTTGQDIILISSTVSSGDVIKFAWVDKPLAVWEQGDFDDYAMTSSQGNTTPVVRSMIINDNSHPLATGLPTGESLLTSSDAFSRGVPFRSAEIIALMTEDQTQALWFVYEKGDSLEPSRSGVAGFPADGLAPEMRIGLPFGNATFETITPEGVTVLMNTLDYMFDGAIDSPLLTLDFSTVGVLSMQPGERKSVNARIFPSNVTDNTIMYTSSDPAVAIVNGNGMVTALAEGMAEIWVATGDGGGKDTVDATVTDMGTTSILFVAGGGGTPGASDAEIIRMLKASGYIVNYVADNVCTIDDTLANDIIMASSTVNSGSVVKYAWVDKPVALWENAAYDNYAIAHGWGTTNGNPERSMTIADNTPVIATGLPVGDMVLAGTDAVTFGYIYPTAKVIGTLTEDQRPIWFYYEKGDTLDLAMSSQAGFPADGLAPNVRMGLPFNNNTFQKTYPAGATVLLNSMDFLADGAINAVRPAVKVMFPEEETPELLHPATYQLVPWAFPSNTTDTLDYMSLDEGIATVTADGLVSSVDKGTVGIVVSLGNYSDTLEVFIRNPIFVSGVSLDITSSTLEVWDELQLTATIDPANADTSTVNWMSSNPAVVTVDENGMVHAVSAGTATITVTTDEGGKTATTGITVILQDATLSGLVSSAGTMEPAFSPEVTAYTLTMPVGSTSAFLIGQATREDAVVTGDGAFNLMNGSVTATIVVTCPAGNTMTYKVSIAVEEVIDGMNSLSKAGVRLYPNPAGSSVTLQGVPAEASVRLMNSLGQVVMDRILNVRNETLDVSGLGQGMYLMQVEIGGEKFHSKLIIK